MKIVSVLFDDLRYDEEDVREMERYYQDNVDPTARPLAINVDYKDALMRCYDSLKDAIQGRKKLEDLGLLEGAYYISCSKYLEIVTGQKPLSYFDEFVKEWNRQGGEKIRGEVAQELKGK